MMNRIVSWGVICSVWSVSAIAQAQLNLDHDNPGWSGSFLSAANNRMAGQPGQPPQAPDVDQNSLPAADAEGAGLAAEVTPPSADAQPSVVPSETLSTPGLSSEGALGHDDCATGECSTACLDGNCGCSRCGWFGGIYGLIMRPEDDSAFFVSFENGNTLPGVLNVSDAEVQWGGGFETRVGYYLNECYAVEGVYWGLFPETEEVLAFDSDSSGTLNSLVTFDGLCYNAGTQTNTVTTWFGTATAAAQAHRIQRSFETHNVELNLIRNPYRRCGCAHYEILLGVRYLKFDDNFRFSSDLNNTLFGDDPANELHYVVDVENHLLGGQIGGRMDYYLFGNLSAHAGSKLGIYGNHVKHQQRIVGGNGLAFNTLSGDPYDIDTSEDDVAFLGELFAGLSYDLTNCWRITGGYRAISTSGVSLATSQIPRDADFESLARASQTDTTDSLILHGAYFGLEYNW